MASVYKRAWSGKDGRERVRWVAAYKDQDGGRHNKGFRSRKDAKAFLVLTEGEIVRGVHTPESTSVTVAEAARLWLRRGELEKLERSTLRQYKNHVGLHILPLIGTVKLAAVDSGRAGLPRQAAGDPLAPAGAQDPVVAEEHHR
jgi:integrase